MLKVIIAASETSCFMQMSFKGKIFPIKSALIDAISDS